MSAGLRKHVALLLALFAMTAYGAPTLTVTPDRTEVFENESFTVDFVYSDELRDQPGFDVLLEDFQIIATQPSSNLLSVNGRFRYEFSYSLTLMPRRVGELVIPPIRFDDVRSEPLTITVKEALKDNALEAFGDLHLEVTMTPERGYVQGQFIFTQRLYHRGWLAGGKLSPPTFGDRDAVVKPIDQAKRYSLFRDGERYQIYEQSYLVFPQASGTLTAEPTNFTGQLREPGEPPRLKRVSAPALSVEVLGVPDGVDGDTFLPSTKVSLTETWPATVKGAEQGQPITRVIRLTADGQMAAQLRAIDIPDIDGVRIYADQPQRDDIFAQSGVTGAIQQSLAVVPQKAGTIELPPIEVRWWDVAAGVERVASLPARTLDVAASTAGPGPAAGGFSVPPSLVAANERTQGGESGESGWPYWPSLAITFAGLWLLTASGWGRDRWRRRQSDQASSGPIPAGFKRRLFSRRNAIKRACDEADPRAATQALLDWAAVIWRVDAPRSLGAIAARLDGAPSSEVSRLEAMRYGSQSIWHDPDRLWRAVAHIKPVRSGAAQQARGGLETL
ncbi:MAG: BatD family protein [Pseudomonadota bacterium]